ncbi:MAG: thiamine pyrophosphate-dependent enzyme [Alphaproteobacteria bacterium]|nr:thiamine pyrophosphate-dependent enzyme [Alphaproteobacteria bacterium]
MNAQAGLLSRRAAVAALLAERDDLLVISGLGSATWDVAAAGDHDFNYYLWGAMGGAAMMGLGLALACPERPVCVFTGDGDMLMGLGSLASIALQNPDNLSIVVLDNQRYGETGMQPSHTARGTDLARVASGCGITQTLRVEDAEGLADLRALLHDRSGCLVAVVRIAPDDPPRVLPDKDAVYLKARFRRALLGHV